MTATTIEKPRLLGPKPKTLSGPPADTEHRWTNAYRRVGNRMRMVRIDVGPGRNRQKRASQRGDL